MSSFKTVFDFLGQVPEALAHEGIYRQKVGDAKAGVPMDVDMSNCEIKAVGVGERNLLRSLSMSDKFRYPGMDVSLLIDSGTLAKQKTKEFGKGSLLHKREYNESFLSDQIIDLEPLETMVQSSEKQGLQVPRDAPMYAQICQCLHGISGGSLISPSLALLGEKLVVKQDLRHLFLKGYLMLMSYNLSVAADVFDCEYDEVKADVKGGIVGQEKLGALLSYPIVVDEEHFTDSEIWLLAEMACPYPNTRYGGDNIYSCLQVEGDEMAILSARSDYNPGRGSPERMWNELVSIAIKFEALDDLMAVVRDFRGVPGLLRAVSGFTGQSVFTLAYPRSYSVKLGIVPGGWRKPFVKRNSGYFATTKCLVADLLLGKMMEMSAFNVLEELGCFGTLGCPSGDAVEDLFLNSNLRNYGLRHVGDTDNYLLREWHGIRQCVMPLSFEGCLKKYVQRFGSKLKSGDLSDLRPQLLYDLPYSECRNTTWGTIRGWRMQDFVFEDDAAKRIASNQLVRAFTWVMGIGTSLPKVGMNSRGDRFVENLSLEESKFVQMAAGQYEIGLVRHTVGVEVQPRMDEFEMGLNVFYSTSFPGTRCTIVFDMAGEAEMVQDKKVSDAYSISTLGLNRTEAERAGKFFYARR